MTQVLNILMKEQQNKYQHFDPKNTNHLKAYKSLRFDGRQLPDYRFFVEEPYLDVFSMMQAKICDTYISEAVK
jgi:hypothetical protein